MAVPQPAELTLSLCKLSDMTEPSLGTLLLGMVLSMGHVFLKGAWHICFAQYLLLMAAQLSAWATRCIPAAEGGCSVKSLTSWQLCFLLMVLIWSLCFTHSCGLGKQRDYMQGNSYSDAFLVHTQEKQMGNGSAPRGKGITSQNYRSIWRGFPLESQNAQKQLYVPLYIPFMHQMLLYAITRSYCPLLCVCVCAPVSIPYNMQVSNTMQASLSQEMLWDHRGRSRFVSLIIPAQAKFKWDG